MDRILIYSLPRTGSTSLTEAFNSLGYVNFSEAFVPEKTFRIKFLPNYGNITADYYLPKDVKYFKEHLEKLDRIFENIHRPKKQVYKMFVDWHHYYKDQPEYHEFADKSHRILLFRLDPMEMYLSHALTREVPTLTNKKIKVKLDFEVEKHGLRCLEHAINNIKFDTVILSEHFWFDEMYKKKFFELYKTNLIHDHIENPGDLKRKLILNYKSIEDQVYKEGLLLHYNKITTLLKRKIIENKSNLIGDIHVLK